MTAAVEGQPGTEVAAAPLVLIVDDDAAICEAADLLLTDLGYRTVVARGGREGVRAAALHRPDLILLDVTMPDLDGFAACRAIRADVQTADTPIIFVTARTDAEYKVRAFDLGACDYVTKPFDQGELQARIRAHLGRRVRTREVLGEAERVNRALRAELLQAGKLATIGQLLSGVAHEINNPLTAVLGYAQLLDTQARLAGHAGMLDDVTKLTAAAERAARIARNLLGFSRKREPEPRMLDLNAVVRAACELEGSEMRLARVELDLRLGERLPTVFGDEQQLEQVVLNLMTNARQAIAAGGRDHGRIVVRTSPAVFADRSEGCRLEVQDDGPGIEPSHIERVFDPFFTTKPEGEGTGLGLSLCVDVIRDHGGRISVWSVPGKGARFTVELPGAGAAAPGAAGAAYGDPAEK